MKVALIGASGNVGSRILAELLGRGHEVTGVVRHPEKLPLFAHHYGYLARGVTPLPRQPEGNRPRPAMNNCHLGALSHLPGSDRFHLRRSDRFHLGVFRLVDVLTNERDHVGGTIDTSES